MAQQEDSTKQIFLKFFLELRAGFRAQIQRHILQRHACGLVDLLQAIDERSTSHGNAASVLYDLGIGLKELRLHIQLEFDDVAGGPAAANRKILAGSGACDRLSVDASLRTIRPSGDSQEESELRGFGGRNGNFDAAIPGIICFLADLQADAAFEMPIELRIVVEVLINSLATSAVKISGERSEGAFEIRRAASGVVPIVANLVAAGRIEGQR